MIVSHSRAFVFVAVPKTGSQSVRLALRGHLAPVDWEQCGLFERRRFPVPGLAAIGHGHISCMQLRPHLTPDMWRRYRKFAFVRDPFERFRSLMRFWFHTAHTLDAYKSVLTEAETRKHPLVLPQSEFLCDGDGRLMVDEVGRYAALSAEFRRITGKFSIPYTPLEVRNASQVPEFEPEFDAELRGMLEEFYRDDFRLPGLAARANAA
jgi:hypothetical protein